jgi:predicted RNA binding protein YcfA (HicA-like mRNA interferase family)
VPKLPKISACECIAALQRGGFVIDRQSGSHVTLIRAKPYGRVTVPNHNKDLKPGTLRSIIRQAGLTVAEFIDLL